jgi:Cdc6-like AAA superfamily ATPase
MVQHQSLYLRHFGLSKAPFQITPHTDFFYAGGDRGHLLDAVLYAVLHNEGIVTVTGEVGTGKTMLARMVLERVPAQVDIVYIANPSIGRDEILMTIAEELGLTITPGALLCMADTIDAGDGQHWTAPVYLVEDSVGEPAVLEPDKMGGCGWFALDALPERVTRATLAAVAALRSERQI